MTEFMKSQAFVEYKLHNLEIWLARTRTKCKAEVSMFLVFKGLYENNKTQLSNMKQNLSDFDEQLYDFLCLEKDENRHKAQMFQASYRAQKQAVEKLELTIDEMKTSAEKISNCLQDKVDNYEALLNLCILKEKELLGRKEKYEAVQKEMRWLINFQNDLMNDKGVKYFGQRIWGVEARLEILDQRYRDTDQTCLSYKQELINKSVAMITQWIKGDTTAKSHIFSLWNRCLQNPVQTTDMSTSTIIRELLKNNMDLIRDCPKIEDPTIQKHGRALHILLEEDSHDWKYIGDVSTGSGDMSIDELDVSESYEACKGAKVKKSRWKGNRSSSRSNKQAKTETTKPWLH